MGFVEPGILNKIGNHPWNAVFLIGFIVYVDRRRVFKAACKSDEMNSQAEWTVGKAQMLILIPGALLFQSYIYLRRGLRLLIITCRLSGTLVRCRAHDSSAFGSLPLLTWTWVQTGSQSSNPQRASLVTRCLPLYGIRVCTTHLVSGAGSPFWRIGWPVVRFTGVCPHVFCSHTSRRRDDVVDFGQKISRLHAPNRTTLPSKVW